MSPTNHQAKTSNMYPPPPLKVNKDSHMIKKSSPPSSSSSSSSSSASSSLGIVGPVKPPQRHPVIIYTHSPKIIHTNPKDFMSLVQKLTGLSRSEEDPAPQVKRENGGRREENKRKVKINDGNEGGLGDGQVQYSCFMQPLFQPPNLNYIPVFAPNSAGFLCANQPFYNYTDPLYFPSPNRRNSIATKSTLEVKNEFCGTTGAAGMLNHHSLSLLVHLSVLAVLGGEYLVNVSKKVNRIMYLLGMKARIKATPRRVNANFSLAC